MADTVCAADVTIAVWVYKAQLYGEVDGGDGRRVAKNARASTDDSDATHYPRAVGEEKESLLEANSFGDPALV